MLIPNISAIFLVALGLLSIVNAYQPSNVHVRGLIQRRQNNQNNNRQNNQNQNQNNQNTNNGNNDNNNNDNNNNGNNNNGNNNNGNNNGNNNAGNLALNPANVQSNSALTGQEDGDDPAQADSATDNANFINFCTGKTLTNGLQVQGGSCNGIVMGDIPSTQNMVSSIITSPQPGQNIAANTAFDIEVQVTNLQAGSFTNPANTYYAAPQALQGGKVVGHTHVTIQSLGGSLTPNNPPDAATFEFFKGINDDGNGNGLLSASVTGGLPAGFYRVCTMASASNHQPVLMPIAQRGAQDDCTKFTVGQGNGNNNNNNNNGGNQNQGQNQGQGQGGGRRGGRGGRRQ